MVQDQTSTHANVDGRYDNSETPAKELADDTLNVDREIEPEVATEEINRNNELQQVRHSTQTFPAQVLGVENIEGDHFRRRALSRSDSGRVPREGVVDLPATNRARPLSQVSLELPQK